jgi:hypothetical protein
LIFLFLSYQGSVDNLLQELVTDELRTCPDGRDYTGFVISTSMRESLNCHAETDLMVLDLKEKLKKAEGEGSVLTAQLLRTKEELTEKATSLAKLQDCYTSLKQRFYESEDKRKSAQDQIEDLRKLLLEQNEEISELKISMRSLGRTKSNFQLEEVAEDGEEAAEASIRPVRRAVRTYSMPSTATSPLRTPNKTNGVTPIKKTPHQWTSKVSFQSSSLYLGYF